MNNRILVSGAQGFLGTAIANRLRLEHYKVIGTSRKYVSEELNENLTIDWTSKDAVEKAHKLEQIEAFVHLAAAFPGDVDEKKIIENNCVQTQHAVQFAHLIGAKTFIFASSISIYGDSNTLRDESSLPQPTLEYAKSKLYSEAIAFAEGARLGLRVCSLRIAACYGGGQIRTTVVGKFIKSAMKNEPIVIFGTGSRAQDFIHSSDVAYAVFRALQSPKSAGIFNISSGTLTSTLELAQKIIRITNSQSMISYGPEDPQEELRLVYDNRRALSMLNFSPQVSLDQGIENMWQYLKNENRTSC
jgi:UDP-glucose 4-epimerase